MSIPANNASRTTYHHGDLRNVLTETAVDLARDGGPDAEAHHVLTRAARAIGGGAGGKGALASAGGRHAEQLPSAVAIALAAARASLDAHR